MQTIINVVNCLINITKFKLIREANILTTLFSLTVHTIASLYGLWVQSVCARAFRQIWPGSTPGTRAPRHIMTWHLGMTESVPQCGLTLELSTHIAKKPSRECSPMTMQFSLHQFFTFPAESIRWKSPPSSNRIESLNPIQSWIQMPSWITTKISDPPLCWAMLKFQPNQPVTFYVILLTNQ